VHDGVSFGCESEGVDDPSESRVSWILTILDTAEEVPKRDVEALEAVLGPGDGEATEAFSVKSSPPGKIALLVQIVNRPVLLDPRIAPLAQSEIPEVGELGPMECKDWKLVGKGVKSITE
jgi:hypothetical protein